MPHKKNVRVQATLPSIVDEIIEQKLSHLGAKKSERVRNIIMIYLAEKGYFREICGNTK
jgi:hypothetical protein